MEAYEYQTLFNFETSYWWYHALHRVLLDQLASFSLPAGACILDAGCGTGKNLANIQQLGYRGYGFDYSAHATPFWKRRALKHTCIASTNQIPFSDSTFDAVMSIDVFESESVDETEAYAELWRVTKPGGYLLLVVPAYDWLLTEEHHRAIHASRRYSRRRLVELVQRQQVKLVRVTHLFALLFPVLAIYRMGLRYRRPSTDAPRSDLKPLPTPINQFFKAIMSLERGLLSFMDLPAGSSILVIARKEPV